MGPRLTPGPHPNFGRGMTVPTNCLHRWRPRFEWLCLAGLIREQQGMLPVEVEHAVVDAGEGAEPG
jgi:hypothetical protein